MTTFLRNSWSARLSGSLLLAGALWLGSAPAQAQVDTYQFAASTGTFTPLVGGTPVTSIQGDDVLSATLPLSFTFVFDGTPYTQCRVSSNGWLTFNTTATGNNLNNDLDNGPAGERPRVAPFWDDMHGGAGTASYLTTGAMGSRVFTFEWLNWYRYSNTGGPSLSMQVQLFEGTNVVRFVYRQETAPLMGATASIGLSGMGMGSGSFLSLSDATANPTVSSTVESDMIASKPPTGQIYQFTPPAPTTCPTPRNLTATVTTTTATVTWAVTNAMPGPFTIIYGPTGFNPATGGMPISGVTGTSTTISGLSPNTTYQFYVTQNCGAAGNSTISNAGSFTTNPMPAANDDCANAITLPVTMTCATPQNGTVLGATQSVAASTGCGTSPASANDVWYSFTATSTSHTITMTSQFNAVFDIRSGTCATSTSLYCNTTSAGGNSTRIVGGLTVGQAYFLRVYSSGTAPAPASSSFTLCVVPGPMTPVNDDCSGAINVPIQYGTMCVSQTSGDNTAATASTGVPPPGCASYSGQDVWFRVTVPASGEAVIQTVAPTAGSPITDTGMAVYSGACTSLTLVQCDDDSSPNGFYSLVTLTGRTPGEVLYVRTWAYGGGTDGLIAVCATSPSNCPLPTALAAANLTNTTASLSWTAGGTVGAGDTFEIEYGTQGFTLGTGTALTAITGTSYQLTGLAPNTNYCYYVRQNCGAASGSSTYAGPFCFTTPLTAPANDDPCGALPLSSTGITASNVGATTTQLPGISLPACSPSAAPRDVWFTLTPATTSTALTFTGPAAGMVRVFTAADCATGPFVPFLPLPCQTGPGNNQSVGTVNLTGLTPGQRYYVAVSGFGSSDMTGSFTVRSGPLSSRAQAETAALVVYPNPSSTGQLTLRLSSGHGASQATLLNALGQVVHTATLPATTTEHSLSTRGLAAGIYTLRVQAGKQVLTRKVVLE